MDSYQELALTQTILVYALLLGFGVSIATQLVTSDTPSKPKTIAFFVFFLSALLFFIGLSGVVNAIRFLYMSGGKEISEAAKSGLNSSFTFFQTISGLGQYCFLAGLASLGWVKSRKVGIATSLLAIVTIIVLVLGNNMMCGFDNELC